ncbi:ABC transporter ATP-binding protein [Phyllobacterium zundukense]|uniref:Glycerol-3-phosphate ABC transporter ATP-binding protein n=1 Tax=Phyllobacterium zundukense TaxID=1867719 RepID=A0A2N9VYW2_9HYPH|nr:ABC transporter ATP-binding protein [Phyllobacterium zundukense]ATU95259.1 glycerol-3-phosphate ABC transporter ATP-binding protein [Phyllobacterium zundukense]PIO44680.1 glycerol-3-phosphate ABC transporter ATP-binding protein [Phyllobacterium zundukense]
MAALDLHIDKISKRYGATDVLRGISLRVAAGEFLTLLGPSGCGKSTLLRIIAGLERADHGHVRAGGRGLDAIAPKDRELAFVFQSYALYPHLSVYDNIAAPLIMRELTGFERLPVIGALLPGAGQRNRSIEERVRQTSALLKLDALLDRRPAALSGGQRQRVALGRAMVRNPKIFLMDEPLANLDAALRIHTRGEIARLHREMGTTTIFVTHDQAEAAALSDRVAIMFGGEIRQVASPADLYREPVDLDVARFLAQPFLNELAVTAPIGGGLMIGGNRIIIRDALGSGEAGTLAFRPEHAFLVGANEPGVLPVQVARIEHAGTDAYVFAEASAGGQFVVRIAAERAHAMRGGETLGLSIDQDKAWFFPFNGSRQRRDHSRAA